MYIFNSALSPVIDQDIRMPACANRLPYYLHCLSPHPRNSSTILLYSSACFFAAA